MLDDPRGPKYRRRLYIANPDPDDTFDDRDDDHRNAAHSYQDPSHYHPNWFPGPVNASHHSPPTPSRYIPPLSTPNFIAIGATNPAHAGPGLSPSNASSPAADESTPPPSTPGLPVQSIDPVNADLTQPEFLNAIHNDRSTADSQPSRSGKFTRTLGQLHAKGPRPADPHGRRLRISPTVPAQETMTSAATYSTPTTATDKSDVNKLLIVVTADSERYVTVDITGAKNAAFIRECIFSKLKICQDEEQGQYSIYKTEIGDFAIGNALTEDQLYALCRDRGDNKGSLKFLVSHKNAVVHEEPHRPYTPVINSIPPPVLPNFPSSPLRINPRSRSRHGSASSTSEPMTAEANGYEADLDNADKEKDKPSTRHQQQPSHPNQLQSQSVLRKVSSPPLRPSSPLKTSSSPPVSVERSRQHEPDISLADIYVHCKSVSSNPPSHSPVRLNFPIFEEGTLLPSTSVPLPIHSSPDICGEREQTLRSPEQYIDAKDWGARPQQPPQNLHKPRSNSPKEEIPFPVREHRNELKQELDDWTFVSSPAETESSNTLTQDHRISPTANRQRQHNSPVRYAGPNTYSGRIKAANRVPPAPPVRHAAVPLPPTYLVTWKGEEGGNRRNGLSSPSSTPRLGLSKSAKSMDNLRAGLSPYATGYRRNPLLVSRPNHGLHRENNYYNSVVAATLPKSYEHSRPVRPLPLQGSTHNPSLDPSPHNHKPPYPYNLSLSPNNDPLARPQPVNGETTSPSSSSLRHPNDLLENTRPPRSISPRPRRIPVAGTSYSRHWHNDRSTDAYSGPETSRTTPPRSPASPLSPQYPSHTNGVDGILSSKHGILDEDELSAKVTNGSEATLRHEDRIKMSELLGNNSESTLIAARMPEVDKATPPSPGSTTTATTLTSPASSYNSGYDDDSDSEPGTMLWKKRPEDVKPQMRGPALTVQIGKTGENVSREQLSRANASEAFQDTALRGYTFTDMGDSTWAPRPLPEDVYDRLEEFFPEHDLDKPVIEASSGSTSPTAAEPASSLAQSTRPPEVPGKKSGVKARKSIRYVAEDFKKRIDRKAANTSTYSNIKRNTKLWGSKVEEVTTAQARGSSTVSETSPSNAPTFKWVRGELIGKGTYGRVYLAMNANTGEMMAVKQVELPQTASDRNDSRQTTVVQALKLESETLKDLDHPNIVQYLGFEETPTNLSIFLEYVPGGSVGSCLLKHGRFDENVTKSFTRQILDGLYYLHSKGILHRDLKADNILVEMSGVCKISDFGISKRTDDDAHTAMQGTVFWMAPEVVDTQKKGYNFKVDIWSVGCVVLEMWAGKRPWMGEEWFAVMLKLYQSKLPPPVPNDVKLSELADDFRQRCFAINPEERATAAELMAHPYLKIPPEWHFIKFT
ncbi:hypothetical protein AX15_001784 [Amanita polypyramis BW_CC]|nr:hypothetical protein AX15_001784 [Amanita polypyramis BW_CC]